MTEKRKLNRREFLRISGLTSAGLLVAACGVQAPAAPAEPDSAEPAATPQPPEGGAETSQGEAMGTGQYHQSPTLDDMAMGVDERLPVNPLVMPVVDRIGEYGGTWYRVAIGPGDPGIINSRLSYENLVRWNDDGSGVVPNVAESYEISDDASEFTFHLREGMKWSDGEPFTTNDIAFFYQDVLHNEDLTSTYPKWQRDPVTDTPNVLEQVDDYTFKLSFENPYGLFIQMLAGPSALSITDYPAHYLKQFHPAYTDQAEIDQKVSEANFENWWQLFGDRRSWQNPEQPHIWPWLPKQVPPDVPVTAERNAYYWKVDPEGNQLPYLDGISFDVVENIDLLNLKAIAGEIDMQFRHISWTNFPLYVENAEAGDYQVFQWKLAEGSNYLVMPNFTHKDPVLAEIFQNKDFRVAFSQAIDRLAIRDLIYSGLGEPRQATVHQDSAYFKPEWATRYIEYDPDLANELLDGMGLTERDGDGFRLRPDGEPLTIGLEYAPVFGPWRDVSQLISDQLADVGVRILPQEEDRSLWEQRRQAGEPDMHVWTMDRTFTPLIEPIWFIPGIANGYSANGWYSWYISGGEEGVEPTPEVKEALALYDKIKGASPDALPELATQLFELSSENIWHIGTVGALPHVGVVKNNFHNVPEAAISDWLQLTPGNTAPEQYFKEQA